MLIERVTSHSRNRVSHWNCSYKSGIFHNGSYAMCDVWVSCAPEWASALHVHSASARPSRGRGVGVSFRAPRQGDPPGEKSAAEPVAGNPHTHFPPHAFRVSGKGFGSKSFGTFELPGQAFRPEARYGGHRGKKGRRFQTEDGR